MKYYAFDFGAGTTCAVEFGGYSQNPATGKETPVWTSLCICNTGNGRHEIPTYFAKTNDDCYIIGEEVADIRAPQWIKRAWKTRPTAASEENKVCTQQFMQEVFYHFAERNTHAIAVENDFTFAIGYPCDWSEEDANRYKDMAQNALRGINNFEGKNVQIIAVRESQAAALYARKKLNVSSDDFNKGVLLIDFGSSTTDFTFVQGLSGLHCGLDLGANKIDQIIAQHALDHNQDAQNWFNRQSNHLNEENADKIQFDILAKARQNKEQLFSSQGGETNSSSFEYDYPIKDLHFGIERRLNKAYFADTIFDTETDAKKNNYEFCVRLHDNKLWAELKAKKQSWRKHFRDVLGIIQKKWTLPENLTVIVTGGASRMDFVVKDIYKVYQKATVKVSDDSDKSYSVANGLAYAAYANLKIEEVRKKFNAASNTIVDEIFCTLFQKFVSDMHTEIQNKMEQYLDQGSQLYQSWKKVGRPAEFKPTDSTNSVKNLINEKLQHIFTGQKEKVNKNEECLKDEIKRNDKINVFLKDLEKEFGVPDFCFDVRSLYMSTDIAVNFSTDVDPLEDVIFSATTGDVPWADAWLHRDARNVLTLGLIKHKDYWIIAKGTIQKYLTEGVIAAEISQEIQNSWKTQIREAIESYFEQYTDAIAGIALIENQK